MIQLIKRMENFYKIVIVLVDLLLINGSYNILYFLKFGFDIPQFNYNAYLEAMPFITIAALVYFDIYGLFKFYRKNLYDVFVSNVFVVVLLGITTVTITYFNQKYSFPRSILLAAPLIQLVLLTAWKGFILQLRKYIVSTSSLMIIGNKHETDNIIEKVRSTVAKSNVIIKYVLEPSEFSVNSKKLNNVDEVLVCPDVPDDQKQKIISHCFGSKKVVYIIPQLFEISMFKSKLVQFEDTPAFMIDRLGLSFEQKFFKRVFDIVISIIGIIMSLPVFLVVIPIIKLTSKGSCIYKQDRVTDRNKVFKMYKLRTMYDKVEEKTGPVISGKDDPRVTRVGKYLRRFRIDELPQLFNVLKGDMSMVGPRSERPFFVERFEKEIPEYSYRLMVKAGLTGYAQILGSYDTSPEDKLRYDLLYIKNFSLLLDIKLVLQTIKVVLIGENIYNKKFEENLKKLGKVVNL